MRDTIVAVECQPAYRVVTVEPGAAYAGPTIPLALIRRQPEEYLGPLHCQDAQASYLQILDLGASMPGVPLGLSFDGGIAVTHTDYRLAEQRWQKLQRQP